MKSEQRFIDSVNDTLIEQYLTKKEEDIIFSYKVMAKSSLLKTQFSRYFDDSVLEYIPDIDSVIKECSRLLKEKGILLINFSTLIFEVI